MFQSDSLRCRKNKGVVALCSRKRTAMARTAPHRRVRFGLYLVPSTPATLGYEPALSRTWLQPQTAKAIH
eukprot:6239670-Alexandrium_andersonii.AAC.1